MKSRRFKKSRKTRKGGLFGFTNSRKTRNDNIKNCKNYHANENG